MTEIQQREVERILTARRAMFRTWAEVNKDMPGPSVYIEYGSVMSNGDQERALGTIRVDPDGSVVR